MWDGGLHDGGRPFQKRIERLRPGRTSFAFGMDAATLTPSMSHGAAP
ncbi:hypothetical protein GL4_0571 [Methyloceanibacter caenitepidi]|uniref:Uncharacterized protein n=1 Tax=Methyloceanibacter caenitepidi TaxID=1384459 RepID=A0A0A8JZP0_9HYPH|nr:hypothetical protein GL4_0571 [Methyloceanibacter caenitepidi]